MYFAGFGDYSFWWIFPVLMMILCFFMMRGRWGSMMCGFGTRGTGCRQADHSDSALEILNRRYASGEIKTEEYEEKKKVLIDSIKSIKE